MKYTFVHLSDLHYIEEKQEAYDLICDRLNKDLTLNNLENPYVIFSGDFVYSGSSQQAFDAIESKFDKYLTELEIPKGKRYCTPGNHDISQEVIKKIAVMQRGILSEMNEEDVFNDSLSEIRAQLNFEKNSKTISDLKKDSRVTA